MIFSRLRARLMSAIYSFLTPDVDTVVAAFERTAGRLEEAAEANEQAAAIVEQEVALSLERQIRVVVQEEAIRSEALRRAADLLDASDRARRIRARMAALLD